MPGPTQTSPSTGVLEFLDQTHRTIKQMLVRLNKVAEAIRDQALTAEVRAEAQAVHDWFEREGRQHHMDEEKHVFPALLKSSDQALVQIVRRLSQDHGWIEVDWLQIEPSLAAAANGNTWFDAEEFYGSVQLLAQLYDDHMLLEESVVYPAASPLMQRADAPRMLEEMEQRRARREEQPRRTDR